MTDIYILSIKNGEENLEKIIRDLALLYIRRTKGNERSNASLIKKSTMLLKEFKEFRDNSTFEALFSEAYSNRLIKSAISSNLIRKQNERIFVNNEYQYSHDPYFELRWNMRILGENSTYISSFVQIKELFDNLIILNKYEEANEILNQIVEEFGLSLWYVENKVFLDKKLNRPVYTSKEDIVLALINFWDMRSSDEVLARDYEYYVRRELNKFVNIYPQQEAIADFYCYMIAPHLFTMTGKSIENVSSYIHYLPLIDKYLWIIDLLEYYISHDETSSIVRKISDVIDYVLPINDGYIKAIGFILSDKAKKTFKIDDENIEVEDLLISGEIAKALDKSILMANSEPWNIRNLHLLIELSQLNQRALSTIDINIGIREVIAALDSLYSMKGRFEDDVEIITKKAFSCIHSCWARNLLNYFYRFCQSDSNEDRKVCVYYTNYTKLSYDVAFENLSVEDAVSFWDNYTEVIEKSPYLSFRYALLNNDIDGVENVCKLEQLKQIFNIKKLKNIGGFETAISNVPTTPLYATRYKRMLMYAMCKSGFVIGSIDYFLRCFFEKEEYAIVAPIEEYRIFIEREGRTICNTLRLPIIKYILDAYLNMGLTGELTICCEDFFYFNDIEKPSQIDVSKFDREQLVFFLRYICTPQILGPVLLSIRTTKELDQERIATCQLLRSIDCKNDDIYELEIRDITQKIFVNDSLVSIESNKIHVNTEGIKSKITKNLRSEFNNFVFFRNHALNGIIEQMRQIEGMESIALLSSETTQLFTEIITTIRNEFVSSGEYGLDGYLSINIRHGTLEGELKAPFSKYDLLATYLVDQKKYDISPRWTHKITEQHYITKVEEAIGDFNVEINEIIKYLKNSLIQISTEEKPTKGVFDYSLSSTEIQFFQTYINIDDSFEGFVDAIFDYLWKRTEENLERMKNILVEDISKRFLESVSKLQVVYKEVDSHFDFPAALRWLGEVQTEIDNAIDKISMWFRRSVESQHADFNIELPYRIGIQEIKYLHPEKKFEIDNYVNNSKRVISGQYLKSYRNVFYTIFDNISVHGLTMEGVVHFSVWIEDYDDHFHIRAINDYDCTDIKDKEFKLNSVIQMLGTGSYLTKAKQEGGSGIPKIYKIIKVDLGMKPEITFKFDSENNKFEMNVVGRKMA